MSFQDNTAGWTAEEVDMLRQGVLRHALECVASVRRQGTQSQAEAKAWMLNDDREQPFGFPACCEAAGVEPGALRSSLFGMIRQRRQAA